MRQIDDQVGTETTLDCGLECASGGRRGCVELEYGCCARSQYSMQACKQAVQRIPHVTYAPTCGWLTQPLQCAHADGAIELAVGT